MLKSFSWFIFIIGIFLSAPIVAHLLDYSPLLGEPMGVVAGYPIYLPWDWARWFYQQDNPKIQWVFYVSLIPVFGGAILTALVYLVFYRSRTGVKNTGSFGTARWATKKDLKEAGLLGYKNVHGVCLAQTEEAKYAPKNGPIKKKGQVLIDKSTTHVCCIAPTGAGKGVGFVIPTMITWGGSAIVLDIKGEIHELTAGYRSQFSNIVYFNPTVENTSKYNPLDEIRVGTHFEIQDTQNVVKIISSPADGGKGGDPYWTQSAEMVLLGAILHLKYKMEHPSFYDLLHFISGDSNLWASEMVNHDHTPNGPHPEVARVGEDVLGREEKNRSSVITSATANLYLFADSLLAQATSKSDFTVESLVDGDRPTTLYVAVPSSDLVRLNPILRILFTFIFLKMSSRETTPGATAKQHKLLMMLDEFPQLGRMESIESNLAFCRGYGIKVALITQSVSQINKAYTRDNSILDNVDTKVFFAANDQETAERISKILGTSTEIRKNISASGKRMDIVLDNINQTQMEVGRPLLTPGEVLTLKDDQCLVLQNGRHPARAKKIRYYADPRFMDILNASPSPPEIIPDKNEENQDDQGVFSSDPSLEFAEEILNIDDILDENGNFNHYPIPPEEEGEKKEREREQEQTQQDQTQQDQTKSNVEDEELKKEEEERGNELEEQEANQELIQEEEEHDMERF